LSGSGLFLAAADLYLLRASRTTSHSPGDHASLIAVTVLLQLACASARRRTGRAVQAGRLPFPRELAQSDFDGEGAEDFHHRQVLVQPFVGEKLCGETLGPMVARSTSTNARSIAP
jgi:hypothetical protein